MEIFDNTSAQNPLNFTRSTIQVFYGADASSCLSGCDFRYNWQIFQIDRVTYQVIQEIDIEINPTRNSIDFKTMENSLPYGLFKVVLTGTVINPLNLKETYSQAETYIQVTNSDILVFGIDNGVNQVTIGKIQSFTLNPATYSIDLDQFIQPSSLSFKFYCLLVDLNQPDYNYLLNSVMNDLKTIKTQSLSLPAQSCFDSTGN